MRSPLRSPHKSRDPRVSCLNLRKSSRDLLQHVSRPDSPTMAQQWVANSYLLVLGSLILIGGSLGDIYGERRIFAIGVAAFGIFSLACALAPTIEVLISARALQGAAGALLTPSSLAI